MEITQAMVDAAARALCKCNGNCFADDGKDLCPTPADCRDWSSFRTEASAALLAAVSATDREGDEHG